MKILVTGVAGFIGSHVAERLLADGNQVVGVDNLLTGRRGNVPAGVQFEWGDVKDMQPRDDLDAVVHCAASYNDPARWRRDVETNVVGTIRATQTAIASDCRLIYMQTSLCYGINPPPYPLPPAHPLNPSGSYAVSKTAGEAYIRDAGVDYVSFRLANIYGPRNLSGPVPAFYKRIRNDQVCTVVDSRRDYVYVTDAVNVFVEAVYGQGNGVYHVSTGGDYPIRRLWQLVADELGGGEMVEQPRNTDDAPTILLDPTRTIETFGWEASTPLDVGIGWAVGWYDTHGVGDTFTHLVVR